MGVESIVVNVVSNIGKIAKDTDKATKSLGGFKGAIKGIGTALKATGLALLAGIMAKFFHVLSQNQKVIDFFNTSMNGLNIVMTDLINSFSGFFNFISDNIGTVTGYFKEIFENPVQKIKDFGNAIWDNLVERFNSLLDTFGHVGKALGHLFEGKFKKAWESAKDASKEAVDIFTGVDNTFDKMKETAIKVSGAIADYAKGTWEAAEATTALDKAVASSASTLDRTNKLFAKNALEQQQIIDNELLSFEKRQEALEELTRLTEENDQANLEAAALRVKQAQDLVKLNDSEANKIALMTEQNALMDVQAQKLAAEEELFDQKILLNDQWNEVQSEAWDKEIKRLQELADEKIAIAKAVEKAKLDLVKTGFGVANALAGENVALSKGVAMAQTVYQTQQAIMAAMGATSVADKLLPYPLRLANAIGAGVMGAAALAKIASTSPTGAGASTGTPTASAQSPAPEMMSGAFTLSGGQEVEPTRAYVVSDDITNNQNKLAIIRRRATI